MNRAYNVLFSILKPICALLYPRRALVRGPLPEGAAVFCANHSNYIDPVLLSLTVGRQHQLHFMAKAELGKIKLLGRFLRRMGAFFVSRGSNDLGAIKTALGYLKKGEKIGIFPEGTRVSGEDSATAKNGAVRLAMRTASPIVPVFITRNKKLFRRVDIVVGEPYYADPGEEISAQTSRLMERIHALDPMRHEG